MTDDARAPGPDRAERLAAVHYLPRHDDPGQTGDVTGPVLDAEVISEEEYQQRRPSQKDLALQRLDAYRRDVTVVVNVVRTVANHRRTRTVGNAVVRNAWYPIAGVGVAVKRWRDTHGASRYERMMAAAEAAGEQDRLLEWEARDVAEKQRRHERVMDWVTSPWRLVKAAGAAMMGLAAMLLALGVVLAIAHKDISEVIGPISAVVDAIAWMVWLVTVSWVVLLGTLLGAGVAYLWHLGRGHTGWRPQWAAGEPLGEPDVMDQLPDEGTIINALRNLNIRGFNQALKEGWRLRFRMPPTIDGKGWRAQIDLPPACPVEEIVKRKKVLAHNLVRYPIEVWPTEPQASVLDLWVANPGALSGPVDPWPLLKDLDTATCDYFTSVPVGVTIRGEVVRGRLSAANYFMGGVMGSGKSTLAITLVLAAMLDPLVDIDVVVMAQNFDYEPMRSRLRSLVTGAGPDTVATCLDMLRELYEDLDVRGEALREHAVSRDVTRELAERDERLRPRLVIIDECQNLFIGDHGKDAIETVVKLISAARKYAITLVFLTPEPSKDACPRKIVSVISNKACFAIGDQTANDAVLGTGSYKSGLSAVGLDPKTDESNGDVGTCMARGFMPKPGLMRCFYVPEEDAARVTQRAMQLREQAQISTTPAAIPAAHQRDPLADIAAVLGDQRRRSTQDVLQRLTERDRWYADWTFEALTKFLTAHEAAPYKTGGKMHVKTDLVVEALTRREELAELTEPDSGPET